MAVNISEEEVKRIFFEKFLPEIDNNSKIELPIKEENFNKAMMDGGFSSIYTFTDANETEFVMKVLSTSRTDFLRETDATTCALNEILALYCLWHEGRDAIVMYDCFEYKPESSIYNPEDLKNLEREYIYFIIMPKYKTFGEHINTKKNSEKNIYCLTIDLLEALKSIHEPINFIDSYEELRDKNIVTFENECLYENNTDNYINDRIILHNDIKPGNFLVTGKGKVLFSDFGAMDLLDPSKEFNRFRLGLGTKPYYAPELDVKDYKIYNCRTNSDLYSLGITIIELLPHDEKNQVDEQLITPEFWDILKKMTEEDPDKRYETEEEAITDLKKIENLISSEPYSQEINEITKFKVLLAERNIKELYNEACKRYIQNSDNAFNIRFYSYAKACYNGIKSREDFEVAVRIIKPLIDDEDKVALCLPYIYLENMGYELMNESFNKLELYPYIEMLKKSCEMGFVPAQYLYAKRICRKAEMSGYNSYSIVELFDSLLDKKFIPALKYYRKLLENPAEGSCIYESLNFYERNDRIEQITNILAVEKEESMACMFFNHLAD